MLHATWAQCCGDLNHTAWMDVNTCEQVLATRDVGFVRHANNFITLIPMYGDWNMHPPALPLGSLGPRVDSIPTCTPMHQFSPHEC